MTTPATPPALPPFNPEDVDMPGYSGLEYYARRCGTPALLRLRKARSAPATPALEDHHD